MRNMIVAKKKWSKDVKTVLLKRRRLETAGNF